MRLLKQAANDIINSIGWMVFYGLLTTLLFSLLVMIGFNYNNMSDAHENVQRMLNRDLDVLQLKEISINAPDTQVSYTDSKILENYMLQAFSEDGKAGSVFRLSGERLGYQNIYVLLGIYTELVTYSPETEEKISFAVTADVGDPKGTAIRLEGKEYTLGVLPDDISLYFPGRIMLEEGSQGLKNSLFVFCTDYSAFAECFPRTSYMELMDYYIYFENMMLQSPSEADVHELKQALFDGRGEYASIISLEDYLGSSDDLEERTNQLYYLFFVVTIISMIIAMSVNIWRIIEAKQKDYLIHYVYGASQMRMLVFVFAYHLIPAAGTVIMLRQIRQPAISGVIIWLGAALALTAIITTLAWKKVFVMYKNGLHGE